MFSWRQPACEQAAKLSPTLRLWVQNSKTVYLRLSNWTEKAKLTQQGPSFDEEAEGKLYLQPDQRIVPLALSLL